MTSLSILTISALVITCLAGTAYAHNPQINEAEPTLHNPKPISELPEKITYRIQTSYGPQNETRIIHAIENGFVLWEALNPELNFERVDYNADIVVHWVMRPHPERIGYASHIYEYTGTITLYIGDFDCNGKYVEWSTNSLQDTTMHEIGHLLGLGHTLDKDHLMYGDDEWSMINFDTLGYNIPEPFGYYYVGEKALSDALDDSLPVDEYYALYDLITCYNNPQRPHAYYFELFDRLSGLNAYVDGNNLLINILFDEIAKLEEKLDNIEKQISDMSVKASIQKFNSPHDGSYIEIQNHKSTYYIGDTIQLKAYIDQSNRQGKPFDYGIFLVAGVPGKTIDSNTWQGAGYLGRLFGQAVFGSSTSTEFYGPGFYCNGPGNVFDLKFERNSTLNTFNGWGDAGTACPILPNTEGGYEITITKDYPKRPDYQFVIGTSPDTGFKTPIFSIQ